MDSNTIIISWKFRDARIIFAHSMNRRVFKNNVLRNQPLKGNGGLEKKNFFFFSKARKYGEEIKIKKKNVFLFSRPDNRLF